MNHPRLILVYLDIGATFIGVGTVKQRSLILVYLANGAAFIGAYSEAT